MHSVSGHSPAAARRGSGGICTEAAMGYTGYQVPTGSCLPITLVTYGDRMHLALHPGWPDTRVSRLLALDPDRPGPVRRRPVERRADAPPSPTRAGWARSASITSSPAAIARGRPASCARRLGGRSRSTSGSPNHDLPEDEMTRERFAAAVQRLAAALRRGRVSPRRRIPSASPRASRSQAEAVLEARPAAFSFVFGIPDERVLEAFRERGIVTLGTATTPDEAVALDEAGIDIIVASGAEAGGHRGAFLAQAEDSLVGTLPLVRIVVEEVRAPVIAAGGIADADGIAAALALGAEGVQIGTAFLATEESGTTPEHRPRCSAAARRTTLTRAFSGRLARGIPNRLMDRARRRRRSSPTPTRAISSRPILAAAAPQGRTDVVAMWSGQATPLLRHRSAADALRRPGRRHRPPPHRTTERSHPMTTAAVHPFTGSFTADPDHSSFQAQLRHMGVGIVPHRLRRRRGPARDGPRRTTPDRPRPRRLDHDQAAGGVPRPRRRRRGLLRRPQPPRDHVRVATPRLLRRRHGRPRRPADDARDRAADHRLRHLPRADRGHLRRPPRRAGPRGRDRPPRLGHDLPGPAAARRRRALVERRALGPPRARRATEPCDVLGISGSLRADSFNTALLRAAARLLPPAARMPLYAELALVPRLLRGRTTPSPPRRRSRASAPAIAAADALLIATPEYNASIPGQLKNALDWASRPYPDNVLRGKPVAVVGASTGIFGAVWAQAELRKVLATAGAHVLDTGLSVAHAFDVFDPDLAMNDGELRSRLAHLLLRLHDAASPVIGGAQ